jgi:hypothetical protein
MLESPENTFDEKLQIFLDDPTLFSEPEYFI